MLLPKKPPFEQSMVIYKGFVEEGEGQYPIKKTEDVIDNIGGIEKKLLWAARKGFVFASAFSIFDIFQVNNITDKRAMFARYCFYTIPVTAMAVTWMGGVELSKNMLGRDNLIEAHVLGAAAPAGVYGVWRRCMYRGIKMFPVLVIPGAIYAMAVKHNLTLYSTRDNPNIPMGFYSSYDTSFVGAVRKSDKSRYPDNWLTPEVKESGPTWKKWDTEEE